MNSFAALAEADKPPEVDNAVHSDWSDEIRIGPCEYRITRTDSEYEAFEMMNQSLEP